MSWTSGHKLLDQIIEATHRHFPDKKERTAFYEEIITSFEDFDCDTLKECKGFDDAFDQAYNNLNPEEPE